MKFNKQIENEKECVTVNNWQQTQAKLIYGGATVTFMCMLLSAGETKIL